MAKRKTEFWDSAKLNSQTYKQYYNRLMELCISAFEWKNLPETVDPRFLELTLFANGSAIFFKDDILGYLGLQVMIAAPLNVYRIPTNRRAFASNGYNKQLTEKDSVIVYNNMIRTNSMLDVEMFARRLYEIDRTIDINVRAQKTPVLIKCNENQRLTLENAYMKFDGNQPVIFADNSSDVKTGFDVLSTGAPYVADKLYTLKTQIWNEALTYLGIANVDTEKKERLIVDEVARQQGGTIASRYSRLNARRQAADQINRMFDLNIEVEYRDDFAQFMFTKDNEMGVEEDE